MAKVVEIDFETLRRELWGKSAEVAQVLGIAPENLSRKLRGHRKLTLEELNHIALYLQRDVSDFLIFKSDSSDDSREVKIIARLRSRSLSHNGISLFFMFRFILVTSWTPLIISSWKKWDLGADDDTANFFVLPFCNRAIMFVP